jgi:hypothetical protein
MTAMADERTYMRIQTAAFIAADSKEIQLIPQTEADNGSGGFERTEGAPRTAQTLRLIPQQGSMSPARETLDGEACQPDYILLGVYDADIRRWDLFTDQGRRYIVVFVHENVAYEKKGEVLYLGE